jgi:hypothetical protein
VAHRVSRSVIQTTKLADHTDHITQEGAGSVLAEYKQRIRSPLLLQGE